MPNPRQRIDIAAVPAPCVILNHLRDAKAFPQLVERQADQLVVHPIGKMPNPR